MRPPVRLKLNFLNYAPNFLIIAFSMAKQTAARHNKMTKSIRRFTTILTVGSFPNKKH